MNRIAEHKEMSEKDWDITAEEISFRARLHEKALICKAQYEHEVHHNKEYFYFMEGATEAYRALTKWNAIEKDESGFATDDALDEIFANLPVLVKGKGEMSLITDEDAYEWRGDLERQPRQYLWRKVENI